MNEGFDKEPYEKGNSVRRLGPCKIFCAHSLPHDKGKAQERRSSPDKRQARHPKKKKKKKKKIRPCDCPLWEPKSQRKNVKKEMVLDRFAKQSFNIL